MKKVLVFVVASLFGAMVYAQTNTVAVTTATTQTQVQSQPQQTIVIPVEAEKYQNFSSFGNDWIEAGFGVSLTGDTGMTGYIDGNVSMVERMENGFALDGGLGVTYLDMHNRTLTTDATIIPSYYIGKVGIVDVTGFANVLAGYGSINEDESTFRYGAGVGVEFSMGDIYIAPYYNWINYECFDGTITTHAVGGEVGLRIPQSEDGLEDVDMAIILNYSHVFSNAKGLYDAQDMITVRLRVIF